MVLYEVYFLNITTHTIISYYTKISNPTILTIQPKIRASVRRYAAKHSITHYKFLEAWPLLS